MTEYKVHRIRFVEHTPQAIHCLAFEDSSLPRLAVSRQDGTIEIWNLKNTWTTDFAIPGNKNLSIESLVWCKSRLFSAGLNGEIIEWDLKRLNTLTSVDSYGGPVWCLAADHAKTRLAAGCEDGGLRLYEVLHKGLQFISNLDKQEERILSLSWGHEDDVIVTGGADSTIRLYNVKTGRVTLRITADKQTGKDTLIWDVYLTRYMTVITGDSLGQTQFWDANHGTLLQSFRSHKADVLTVCVNEAEDCVYSSGIDSRVAQFKIIKGDQGIDDWRLTKHVRAVNHDVRALVTIDTPFHVLVSGGVDPRLIKYQTKQFDGKGFLRMSFCPQKNVCKIAPRSNLLLYQDRHSVSLWKLQDLTITLEHAGIPQKLLEITSNRVANIMCSAISQDGSLVAYADICNLRLFKINYNKIGSGEQTLSASKVHTLPSGISGIQVMQITSDNSKLIVANSEGLHIIDVSSGETQMLVISENNSTHEPLMFLSISKNDAFVAIMDCHYDGNIFDLIKMKHITQIPTLACKPTAMSFQPTTNNLFIACADKDLHVLDIKHGKFTEWSTKLNYSNILKNLPTCSSIFTNIVFNPLSHHEVFLQSDKGFVKLDTATADQEQKIKSCIKYQPILYIDFFDDGSLVVVERPIADLLGALLPALKIKKYGT